MIISLAKLDYQCEIITIACGTKTIANAIAFENVANKLHDIGNMLMLSERISRAENYTTKLALHFLIEEVIPQ